MNPGRRAAVEPCAATRRPNEARARRCAAPYQRVPARYLGPSGGGSTRRRRHPFSPRLPVNDVTLAARLAMCEAEISHLRARLKRTAAVAVAVAGAGGFALVGAAVVTGFASGAAGPAGATRAADSLRVRELVVVDAAGTVRARVGGDLPDAVDPDGALRAE